MGVIRKLQHKMKDKSISNFLFGIFAIVLLAVSASALTLSPSSDSFSLTTNQTITLTLTNNDFNQTVSSITVSPAQFSENGATITLTSATVTPFNLISGESKQLNFNVAGTSIDSFKKLVSHTFTITANASNATGSTNATSSLTFNKGFCSNGQVGNNLSITEIDISNSGDDDETWRPLDKVIVEVKVENIGNNDVKEVTVKLGLINSDGTDKAGSLDFSNTDEEKINLATLNDGDEEKATFEFTVPADFDDGSYKLAVKAFSDKSGVKESKECTDTIDGELFQDISVERESDDQKLIAFDNVDVSPIEVTCGDSVLINFDTVNVGDSDQDQVKVNLFNQEMKIDLSQEFRDNVDSGDVRSTSFSFQVPEGIQDKTYILLLNADYDYRNGVYREHSDTETRVPIKVIGCSLSSSGNTLSISASLQSDAKPGQDLVVRSTIKNIGSTSGTFVISPTGFDSWATLSSISTRTLTLQPGESKDVTMTFNVDESASGTNTFRISAQSGDHVEDRQVSVNIAESSSGLSGFSLGDNWLIWVIVIVNIILIVIIVLVAIRISRR